MLTAFNSIGALRSAAIETDLNEKLWYVHADEKSWYNGESLRDCLKNTASGNTSLVPQAEAFISDIEQTIETPKFTWQPSPVGTFPNVADYCNGLPYSMRERINEPSDTSPVNIVVLTFVSASVPAEIMRARGVAILALVLALSRSRPVNLYLCGNLDGYTSAGQYDESLILTQINTTPLDIATACYVLTSVAFQRYIMHHMHVKLHNSKLAIPKAYFEDQSKYLAEMPYRLGFNASETLIISCTSIFDTIAKFPKQWLETQLKRFTQANETTSEY